jgi:hypothetical protein
MRPLPVLLICACSSTTYYGTVEVGSLLVDGSSGVKASFSSTPPFSFPSDCILTAGACRMIRDASCYPSGPAPSTPASAGTIVVDDGQSSISISPTSSGVYIGDVRTTQIWPYGATLSVRASGGSVAAFSTTIELPSAAEFTLAPSPAPPFPVIQPDTDLPLAWTGGGIGSLHVQMHGALHPAPQIDCWFPAQDGMGVIPSAFLSRYPRGQDLSMWCFGSQMKSSPNSTIEVDAVAPVLPQLGEVLIAP